MLWTLVAINDGFLGPWKRVLQLIERARQWTIECHKLRRLPAPPNDVHHNPRIKMPTICSNGVWSFLKTTTARGTIDMLVGKSDGRGWQ